MNSEASREQKRPATYWELASVASEAALDVDNMILQRGREFGAVIRTADILEEMLNSDSRTQDEFLAMMGKILHQTADIVDHVRTSISEIDVVGAFQMTNESEKMIALRSLLLDISKKALAKVPRNLERRFVA